MSLQAGLKAGAIGAAVMILLGLLGLIPVGLLQCLCCLAIFGAWVGSGLLAARFSPAPRRAGGAAGAGAVAGVVSGLGYGVVNTLVAVVRAARGGMAAVTRSLITPEMLQQLQRSGVDPRTFTRTLAFLTRPGGAALVGSLCCVGALALGAALGAIGGAIGAALFKQS